MAKTLPNPVPFQDYVVYGPYPHCVEGRMYVSLLRLDNKQNRTSMSYARYLVCVRAGRWLDLAEQVDHIDGNRANDSLDNLQILDMKSNIKKSSKGRTMISLICKHCEMTFQREARNVHKVNRGYYCSDSCRAKGSKGINSQKESKLFASDGPVTVPFL